jgi:hypothetical protein
MEDWVLVGTCIWAAFFSKPDSHEKAAVDELIDNDQVSTLHYLTSCSPDEELRIFDHDS